MNNIFLCTYEKLQEYMYFIKSILIFFKTHLDDIFLRPKIHTKYFSTEIWGPCLCKCSWIFVSWNLKCYLWNVLFVSQVYHDKKKHMS